MCTHWTAREFSGVGARRDPESAQRRERTIGPLRVFVPDPCVVVHPIVGVVVEVRLAVESEVGVAFDI